MAIRNITLWNAMETEHFATLSRRVDPKLDPVNRVFTSFLKGCRETLTVNGMVYKR